MKQSTCDSRIGFNLGRFHFGSHAPSVKFFPQCSRLVKHGLGLCPANKCTVFEFIYVKICCYTVHSTWLTLTLASWVVLRRPMENVSQKENRWKCFPRENKIIGNANHDWLEIILKTLRAVPNSVVMNIMRETFASTLLCSFPFLAKTTRYSLPGLTGLKNERRTI